MSNMLSRISVMPRKLLVGLATFGLCLSLTGLAPAGAVAAPAGGDQAPVNPAQVSCRSGAVCLVTPAGVVLRFTTCGFRDLRNYPHPGGGSWADQRFSLLANFMASGTRSTFYGPASGGSRVVLILVAVSSRAVNPPADIDAVRVC